MAEPAAVVFAGGQGTRLWPLSRDRRPKQFQAITGDESLLALTIDRLKELVPPDAIYISTAAKFREVALECRSGVPPENLILESESKGSSVAFALAHAHIYRSRGNVPVLSCPSDHMVDDEPALIEAWRQMVALAGEDASTPVVLGARPTRPDTGLGWFRTENGAEDDRTTALSMVEKPDLDEAQELLEAGGTFWNTANYVAHPKVVLDAYRRTRPYVMSAIGRYLRAPAEGGYAGPASSGHELAPLFEAGVQPCVVVSDFGWNDVGTWPRMEELLRSQNVASIGSSVTFDSEDVLAVSLDGRRVVVAGLEDVLVVTHEDAVFVLDKRRTAQRADLDRWRSMLAAAIGEQWL